MRNLLKINDWSIRRYFVVFFSLQLTVWGAIALDRIGIDAPYLRQLTGFLYLTIVPGFALLRILRIHGLGSIETVIYATCLSAMTAMLTMLLANAILPLFGLTEPVGTNASIFAINVVGFSLLVLSCYRDRGYSDSRDADVIDLPSKQVLLFLSLPVISVIGVFAFNSYASNWILLFELTGIAMIPIAACRSRFMPETVYPIAIFSISLSLLFHSSLISNFITGWDVQIEYYIARGVLSSGMWDPAIYDATNSALSVVFLPLVYTTIAGIDTTLVFKVIYPLFFALVPVGLYRALVVQFGTKHAFYSIFFFVSVSTFYMMMPMLGKQEVAELFLIGILMLSLNRRIRPFPRSLLLILFAFTLTASHYGLAVILIIALIVSRVLDLRIPRMSSSEPLSYGSQPEVATHPKRPKRTMTSSVFILTMLVITLTWFQYAGGSQPFNKLVGIGVQISNSLFQDAGNPAANEGLYFVTREPASALHAVFNYMHEFTQGLILIGILVLYKGRNGKNVDPEFKSVSGSFLIIAIAALTIPFFGVQLAVARLYHIALIFLSPFFVVGWFWLARHLKRILRSAPSSNRSIQAPMSLSVFLAIFLLFNTGVVYVIAHDSNSSSISLDANLDYPRYNAEEVTSAEWVKSNIRNATIYADSNRWQVLYAFIGNRSLGIITENTPDMPTNSYMFLGSFNIDTGTIAVMVYPPGLPMGQTEYVEVRNLQFSNPSMLGNRICDDGGAVILIQL